VKLDGLLADEARSLSDISLGARYGAVASRGLVAAGLQCRDDRHRTSLLGGDVHVDHSML
jgi:chromosome condensin MukBEF ATPase and DNA-binding subunit MukB